MSYSINKTAFWKAESVSHHPRTHPLHRIRRVLQNRFSFDDTRKKLLPCAAKTSSLRTKSANETVSPRPHCSFKSPTSVNVPVLMITYTPSCRFPMCTLNCSYSPCSCAFDLLKERTVAAFLPTTRPIIAVGMGIPCLFSTISGSWA